MCIVVYKPKEQKVDKDIMKECWDCNNDGGGYMYSIDNEIHITKEMDNFQKFWDKYKTEIIDQGLEEALNIVLHFRIKSHGEVSLDNCHPFFIGEDRYMAFCHNGIIKGVNVPVNSVKSDTVLFGEGILDKLPKTWTKNDAIVELVKSYAGDFSKLAFMDKTGKVTLTNESKGEWNEGIWYSNGTYKIVERTTWRSGGGCAWNLARFTVYDRKKGYAMYPEYHSDPVVVRMGKRGCTKADIDAYLARQKDLDDESPIIDTELYNITVKEWLDKENIELFDKIEKVTDLTIVENNRQRLKDFGECGNCHMPIFLDTEINTSECWYCHVVFKEGSIDGRTFN